MLSRGADVNYRTANGFSALSVAANFRGSTDIAGLLLNHGARIERPEIDKKGNENLAVPLPLYLAAGAGEIETFRLLIQHGEAFDDVTGGKTPLLFAIRKGDAPMIRLLIESGASIQGKDRQFAALQTAILANYADILSLLIEEGCDVNATDKRGMTPLHYAAMTDYGDTEVVQRLLAAGATRLGTIVYLSCLLNARCTEYKPAKRQRRTPPSRKDPLAAKSFTKANSWR